MIQDDFDQLLSATAEVFDVPKGEILRKYSQHTSKARWFMAHIIQNGLVHLRKMFIEKSDISRVTFYKGADTADEMIFDSKEDLCLMNEIRERVGLPKLKRAVTHKAKISDTKTLFGFDYTEIDIIKFRYSCIGARDYMNKLCSIGRKPIPDGMVYSPIQKSRAYDSWYRE